MNKRIKRSWKKSVLALLLAFVLALEPSVFSMAANGQIVMEEVATEEDIIESVEQFDETESVVEEISEMEEDDSEETILEEEETVTEENVTEVEPPATEEITSEVAETITEEEEVEKIASQETVAVNYSTNTATEFVITEGVLTSYIGTATEVIIPEGVTEIAENVFKKNTNIEYVECPDTLTTIGANAFAGCSGLKEVKLNEGLTTIGNNAFSGAGFGGKTETQATVYGTLTIPSTVTSIGAYAFENSIYLKEVVFENGETESLDYGYNLGNQRMFTGSKNLKKVTLPDRATVIPYEAFKNCTALEEVYLGKNVQTIETGVFNGCASLESVECPETLNTIEESAFSGCSGLKEVKLNEGLTTIGNYAFSGAGFGGKTETQATLYGTLTIPSTVTSIGAYAFENSVYLQEIIFENGETESLTYGYRWDNQNMFAGSKNLKKVTLPDRATVIPYEAFKNCTALEEVYFGKNVQTIDKGAFQGCSSLETIECPASLTTIGAYVFAGCSGLKEAKLNEGLGVIEQYAFSGAAFGGANEIQKIEYGTLVIPSTVYSIGAYAFENCTYLEEISFPNGIIEALELTPQYGTVATFQNCKNLKRVYLPERLKELPAYTFQNCTSLDTLFIPQSVVTIDDNAVRGCNYSKLVIYGEEGSAAEAFADKLGIKFKNKSELGIYVKSIRLNRKSIFAAGEEAINSKVELEATVLPVTAQNKAVVYTSKDEAVATVDSNGVVTIVGYGETDIIASSLENPEITASCHVEILKKWTEEELNEIREYIETNNNLTVVSNVYTNLQNLKITAPDNIEAEWKVPYEVETGVNTYDVCLNKDGYLNMILEDVTVTGITVKSVTIDGASLVQIGKSYQASVDIVTEGGELAKDDYLIEWRSANNANVKVTASDSNPMEANVSGNKISRNTNIYAKVVLVRDGKAVSVDKSDLGQTWFEPSRKITVSSFAVVDKITVSATQDERPIEINELTELVNIEETVTYELKASAFGYGENISDVAFIWKSSDEKVAKVKTEKDGKVILSVLGKGSSTITVTAPQNGGFKTSFKVTVKDSTPRLVEKNVTINRYLTDASSSISLLPSDDYEIQNESLAVVDAKTGVSTAFEVKPVDENGYTIGIKDGQNVSRGKYNLKILVKTSANEAENCELPISVKVVENVPNVSFRQSAINLFEKDGRGVVEIITDAKIEGITYTSNASLGNVRLVQAETNPRDGVFHVKSENALATNYTNTVNKGTLEITFADYKEEATYSKKITLAVNKKLPSITATPESSTLYPETLADSTEIVLYNKTVDEDVLAKNGYAVSVNNLSNYKYTSNDGITFPEIQALKKAKKGKLIYTITNDKWLEGVEATAKCDLKIGKSPALSFATSKITLNTAYTTGEYNLVTVDAYVKGFSDIVFKDSKTKIKGKDAKSQTVLDDGALEIYLKNGDIKAGITDSKYFTKAGNYTYIVTAYSEDNLPVQGTLKVAVVLSNKKAAVNLKTKGSINLLDRKNTSVIVTPTIKNYTGTVKEVELYGVNAGKFNAEVQNGKIIITAQSGRSIKANQTYKVGMYVTLDSDVNFTTQIKVTPKQKNPKLTQSTKTIVLFESAQGVIYGKDITIDVAAKQSGLIENIELASGSDTFGFELGEDGTGVIYVKETASLKAGKKYSVKLAVSFADDASNAKPSYITVKVDYRK